jgi:hypothetical protein
MIRRAKVSPKAIEGVRTALAVHEEQVQFENQSEEAFRQQMLVHYRLLLTHWEEASE